MPVALIKSTWVSGSLVFHEKVSIIPSATYDILTLGTGAVKVGGTGNDVDFQYYGTGGISAILDCGAKTFTVTGIDMSTDSDFLMGVASKLVIPVKASGSATAGDIWLDTTDNKLHFYNGSAEKTVTDS